MSLPISVARLQRILLRTPLLAVLCSIAFLLWLMLICNVKAIFEFDSDDGNNVIKGLLLLQGRSFGDEIWTDQPPVFSFLLAFVFAIFGATMEVARTLVALFSASIIFLSYELLRRWSGHVAALSAVLLLFISSLFVHLSLSVMIGLPAIALALAGLFFIEQASDHYRGPTALLRKGGKGTLYLLAAGLAGALSLGTKMFTTPIILLLGFGAASLGLSTSEPIDVPGPASSTDPTGSADAADAASLADVATPADALSTHTPLRTRLLSVLTAAGLFAAGLGLGALLAFSPLLEAGTLSGLVDSHARSRARGSGPADGAQNLARFLKDDGALFAIAILGALVAATRRARGPLLVVGWFALCFLALYDHHPVWTHHRTLLTVPAALLAGYAIGELARLSGEAQPSDRAGDRAGEATWPLGLTALLLTLSLVLFSDKDRADELLEPRGWSKNSEDWRVFEAFRVPAAASERVAAARPTHAFRAKKPIPPDLAVTSSKRFATGLLTPTQVARDITDFQPETVLLTERWPSSVRTAVKKAIKKTHVRVAEFRYQRSEIWVERKLAEGLGLEEDSDLRGSSRRSKSKRSHLSPRSGLTQEGNLPPRRAAGADHPGARAGQPSAEDDAPEKRAKEAGPNPDSSLRDGADDSDSPNDGDGDGDDDSDVTEDDVTEDDVSEEETE